MCNSLRTKRRLYFWWVLLVLGAIAPVTPTVAQSTLVATETRSFSHLTLLKQGKIAYEAGRYAQATSLWQQAYQQKQKTENLIEQVLILNYLSLSSQKQGNWQQAEQYITRSLNILESQPELKNNNLKVYAQSLNTKGRLQLGIGKAEAALSSWQQAEEIYQQADDEIGKLGSEINQAQALQNLGLYRRAQKLLEEVALKLNEQSDPTLKIAGLRGLGIALQNTGNLSYAQEILQQSLAISQQLNLSEETSNTLFSLGNVARALKQPENAIAFYQQAATTTTQPLIQVEAQLNQLSLLIAESKVIRRGTTSSQWLNSLLPEIEAKIASVSVSPSRRSIYAQVNLAKSLIDLSTQKDYRNQTKKLLNTAIEQARQLQDTKAESYAVGILGNFYEQQQQWSLGTEYTIQALKLAQVVDDSHLTYQWQWQLGRLQAIEGNITGAVASYSEAVNALESISSDLVVTNLDTQFSFRDSVEPVYRELVSLLLQPQGKQKISQENLLQARNTIESLQLAELNDFFREACLDVQPTNIENIDPKAAVIYPIILSDHLEIIVSLPGKPLAHYSTKITQEALETEIEALGQTLTLRSRRQFYQPAQKLYDWLIRPALQDLTDSNIETLVFISDGTLRNIPMSVLYDGESYLIEQYNVALTPGLQLLAPRPLETVELKTLAAGLTEERQGFTALDYVKVELEEIQKQVNSTVLIDQEFTQETLQAKIAASNFPIVHIATHGQFSSILEETFVLTWDSRININQLDNILSQQTLQKDSAIELLVLSACETAVGDSRAALGLAGMAVRAGARSTLATLWSVNDKTTALLINDFYDQLLQPTSSITKTKALREAQLKFINSTKYNHPYYWGAFILVGNWL
ncbi:MAG: CHAT domain-containing protein [Xenococcaceae cyanobacterium MO_167.B27]|nr:CHAT domain-containing protein [Xenococcaceae cyanobacterium MO_167.B27]